MKPEPLHGCMMVDLLSTHVGSHFGLGHGSLFSAHAGDVDCAAEPQADRARTSSTTAYPALGRMAGAMGVSSVW